jgi:hypothetical protein
LTKAVKATPKALRRLNEMMHSLPRHAEAIAAKHAVERRRTAPLWSETEVPDPDKD